MFALCQQNFSPSPQKCVWKPGADTTQTERVLAGKLANTAGNSCGWHTQISNPTCFFGLGAACSVRGRMGSCFKTGVPMWRNNKKPAFSSKNASVHSCKVLLHHCQAGNLRGAAPKHLHADRSKFPLEGCSAVRKGMRCCGRNTACAPALCQQMESILP